MRRGVDVSEAAWVLEPDLDDLAKLSEVVRILQLFLITNL